MSLQPSYPGHCYLIVVTSVSSKDWALFFSVSRTRPRPGGDTGYSADGAPLQGDKLQQLAGLSLSTGGVTMTLVYGTVVPAPPASRGWLSGCFPTPTGLCLLPASSLEGPAFTVWPIHRLSPS